jgi:Spy/CpxP family protein refolding chaperone
MNNLTKGKVILYLAAIIIVAAGAGGVAGYSMTRHRDHRPPFHDEDMAAHILGRLQSKLDLKPEQIAKINPLLEQTCGGVRATHVRGMREVGRAFETFNQQIAQFLTPEQNRKLAEMERDRQEFMRKRCKPSTNAAPAQSGGALIKGK